MSSKIELLEGLITKTISTPTGIDRDKLIDAIEDLFLTFDKAKVNTASYSVITDGRNIAVEGYFYFKMESFIQMFESNALGMEDMKQASNWQGPEDDITPDPLHNEARKKVRQDSSDSWIAENHGRDDARNGQYDGGELDPMRGELDRILADIANPTTKRAIVENADIASQKFRTPLAIFAQAQLEYAVKAEEIDHEVIETLQKAINNGAGYIVCGTMFSTTIEGEFICRKAVTHIESLNGDVIREFSAKFWTNKVSAGQKIANYFGSSASADVAISEFATAEGDNMLLLSVPTKRTHVIQSVQEMWKSYEAPILEAYVNKEMYEYNGELVESTHLMFVHERPSKYDEIVSRQSLAEQDGTTISRLNRLRSCASILKSACVDTAMADKWIYDTHEVESLAVRLELKEGIVGHFASSYFQLPGESTKDGSPVDLYLPRLEGISEDEVKVDYVEKAKTLF